MEIISITDIALIKKSVEVLNRGGILIFPTETCYGAGVDAGNSEAVTRILRYKERPAGKAISVAVYSEEIAKKYVSINETAHNIYKNFLPGPVTVVSQSKHVLDTRLESEKGSLGIRIPNYKILLDILKEFNGALTSTSANSAGKKTPYTIEDVINNITESQRGMIDLIIDAGELPHNPPSSVIDTTSEELVFHRTGRINFNNLNNVKLYESSSEEETIRIGEDIYDTYKNLFSQKCFLALMHGELGAGKTHLAKGIAKRFGVKQIVKSPSYTYLSEYRTTGGILYHLDAWRIESLFDLEALQFFEWIKPSNAILVEWPSVITALRPDFFEILKYLYIEFVVQDTRRMIRVFY